MFDVASTDYLTVTGFFKARPAEEGGKRFVYMEASNEACDFQGERVMAEALAESADYYAQYGNLDLDHVTQIGQRQGVPDHYLYEIGRPVDVKVSGGKTWVKGAIYAGEGRTAAHANDFWDSITKLNPPKQWYPSVGGAVLEKAAKPNAHGGSDVVVRKVRWTNIGFSATPVNPAVPTVGTVPFGVLAKAWGSGGINLSAALAAISATRPSRPLVLFAGSRQPSRADEARRRSAVGRDVLAKAMVAFESGNISALDVARLEAQVNRLDGAVDLRTLLPGRRGARA